MSLIQTISNSEKSVDSVIEEFVETSNEVTRIDEVSVSAMDDYIEVTANFGTAKKTTYLAGFVEDSDDSYVSSEDNSIVLERKAGASSNKWKFTPEAWNELSRFIDSKI